MSTDTVIVKRHRLHEIVVPGKRLGRHIEHDPRSLAYRVEPDGTKVSKDWTRRIPTLDQGDAGSCTGNATVGVLGTDPFFSTFPLPVQATLVEALAVAIYSDAEVIDGDGPYPPNDNGSSGLSVAKVAKARGLISGYQHITSIDAAFTAIQTGPFIVGADWYQGFDNPTNGLVQISGTVRGGHEWECLGYSAEHDLWVAENSWGTSYGKNGLFVYSSDTFAKLLASDGDATVFVPLSQPAPTPVPPTPAPGPVAPTDPLLAELIRAGNAWETGVASHTSHAGKFKAAFDAYKAEVSR